MFSVGIINQIQHIGRKAKAVSRNCSINTQMLTIHKLSGKPTAQINKDSVRREIANAIGQIHFFNPPAEAAIPPNISPNVKPIVPIVPYTSPISAVESPRRPTSRGSTRKGVTNLVNWASGKRYNSINRIATKACFFLKKEAKVAKNSFKIVEGVTVADGLSPFGKGSIYR